MKKKAKTFSHRKNHSIQKFRAVLGCLQSTKLCWVEDKKVSVKPTNANPKKRKVKSGKSGIWATFSHSKQFFVDWDWFYTGNRLTQPMSPPTTY